VRAVAAGVVGLTLVVSAAAAHAGDKVTVDSLLAQRAKAVGVMPSNAGPGLVLAVTDGISGLEQLYMCFVAETPDSTAIVTQYCKPVH